MGLTWVQKSRCSRVGVLARGLSGFGLWAVVLALGISMDFGQIWSSQVAMGAEAPAAPAAASVKLSIAVIDMQKAILQTEEGKAAKVKIEKDAQSKRDALIKQQDDLNALGQEFQSQQSVLSDESKLERQKEIQSKMQALRTAQISFEQEVRRKEMEETQKIIESLQKIIDEMSRKKGYDFVFERNAGALLYAPSVEDITDEVVKLYNGRSSSKPAKGTKK
jgi:outer membrane protein